MDIEWIRYENGLELNTRVFVIPKGRCSYKSGLEEVKEICILVLSKLIAFGNSITIITMLFLLDIGPLFTVRFQAPIVRRLVGFLPIRLVRPHLLPLISLSPSMEFRDMEKLLIPC
jgi:hypothetical protein